MDYLDRVQDYTDEQFEQATRPPEQWKNPPLFTFYMNNVPYIIIPTTPALIVPDYEMIF